MKKTYQFAVEDIVPGRIVVSQTGPNNHYIIVTLGIDDSDSGIGLLLGSHVYSSDNYNKEDKLVHFLNEKSWQPAGFTPKNVVYEFEESDIVDGLKVVTQGQNRTIVKYHATYMVLEDNFTAVFCGTRRETAEWCNKLGYKVIE